MEISELARGQGILGNLGSLCVAGVQTSRRPASILLRTDPDLVLPYFVRRSLRIRAVIVL